MYKLGILEGDDIGLEVVPECVKVMKTAAAKAGLAIEWQPLPIGRKGHESHGHTMPQLTVDALKHVDGMTTPGSIRRCARNSNSSPTSNR